MKYFLFFYISLNYIILNPENNVINIPIINQGQVEETEDITEELEATEDGTSGTKHYARCKLEGREEKRRSNSN